MSTYKLARDEVELIDPVTTAQTFELLRAYHAAEWTDARGRWHVVITRAALQLVERAMDQGRNVSLIKAGSSPENLS